MVDALRVRLDLAVKADLAVNKVQVQAALVHLVVPVQAQVLHLPPKPAAPVRASRLWRFQVPTHA